MNGSGIYGDSKQAELTISSVPFIHDRNTSPALMYQTLFSLTPVIIAACYYFGISALLLILASVGGCLLTEWFFQKKENGMYSIVDGSALITGILLALCLPPGLPLWMAFLGGMVAIGMGKVIWGGLGQNIFNPALLGRAFLQAAFPAAITTWENPGGSWFSTRGTNLAVPLYRGEIDGISAATPLAQMKFDKLPTALMDLLSGNISGSLGETSGIIILLCGLYLMAIRVINWRIPLSILLSVGVFSTILYLIDASVFPSPLFMIFSGGLLLGAVFMATDPVSSPLTNKGIWIYGAGIGILVILIRVWGGLSEGVMYAILLMNAATPLINRFVKNRVYGNK